jgi:hypothetical protein
MIAGIIPNLSMEIPSTDFSIQLPCLSFSL